MMDTDPSRLVPWSPLSPSHPSESSSLPRAAERAYSPSSVLGFLSCFVTKSFATMSELVNHRIRLPVSNYDDMRRLLSHWFSSLSSKPLTRHLSTGKPVFSEPTDYFYRGELTIAARGGTGCPAMPGYPDTLPQLVLSLVALPQTIN